MECEEGNLHAPDYADVLVRDPLTLEPVVFGHPGLIQVLSTLPRSYPGHSLLTEDLGTIHGEDDCPCARLGKYFSVAGRLPAAELRGCSDTHAYDQGRR
ncbi:Acyl-protein synthetase, LuxE [compost metagenome]